MNAPAHDLDQLVAGLAAVRDDELRARIGSAHAQALLAEILEAPRPRSRRRRAVLAAVTVAALAAGAAGVVAGSHGTDTASAAAVLERAASVARVQSPLVAHAGQFVYTRSRSIALDTYGGDGTGFGALIPWSRESWIGPTGGRMHQVPGQARFVSERDREAWIAAGRPSFTGPAAEEPTSLPPARPLDLPTDPDRLYERFSADAAGYGPRLYDEMFVFVGDSLRETNVSPEQRAALYQVAARIPGVELLGSVVDSAGRRGIAVAKDDRVNRIRSVLVFDPSSSVLLAEEETTLAGNSFGYPAGTRIESVTYLETAVVGSLGARP